LTAEGYLGIYRPWVSFLLIAEMAIDAGCLLASVRWWLHDDEAHAVPALRLAAATVFVHAARVLVFALGRTGPFLDFDIAPEQRELYAGTLSWFEVYLASGLSLLSVIVVFVVWGMRRRAKRRRR
jgi:hypothetical protein